MKTFTKIMMTAAIAMTTLTASPVVRTSIADVPFAFHIGSRQMPAGKYTIARTATGAYIVEHVDTRNAAVFHAPIRNTGKPGSGKLDFRCFAETCEIEGVRFNGDPNTYKRNISPSKRNAIIPTAASVAIGQE